MLARLRKRIDDKEEGFTLIELLVVIIIIGILAAIAIPVFLSQKSKGYEASMKSDLRTAAQEIESANVDAQNYSGIQWGASNTLGATGATTLSGSGNLSIGGSTTFHVSNGNVIAVSKATANGFCLAATHTGVSTTWFYGSQTGGISSSSCVTGTT